MPSGKLYIPGQGVKWAAPDVIPISRQELQLLSLLHEFAVKHEINIFCKRCEKAITGQNNDTDRQPSVACACREWRYGGS